jgi:hypothetical protein
MLGISGVAEQLVASQVGLIFMELVGYFLSDSKHSVFPL